MKIEPTPSPRSRLYDFFSDTHGIALSDKQLDEVVFQVHQAEPTPHWGNTKFGGYVGRGLAWLSAGLAWAAILYSTSPR